MAILPWCFAAVKGRPERLASFEALSWKSNA
jgi:hypothetical protein